MPKEIYYLLRESDDNSWLITDAEKLTKITYWVNDTYDVRILLTKYFLLQEQTLKKEKLYAQHAWIYRLFSR